MSLWVKLGLNPGSVSLQNAFFNVDDYLQVQLGLFPSNAKYFNRSQVQRIGFSLTNQTYKPPKEFGPYYFIAAPYIFGGREAFFWFRFNKCRPKTNVFFMTSDEHEGSHFSRGMVAGVAAGCSFLVLILAGLGIYALRQKRRAEQAISLSKPFGTFLMQVVISYAYSRVQYVLTFLISSPLQLLGPRVGKTVEARHS